MTGRTGAAHLIGTTAGPPGFAIGNRVESGSWSPRLRGDWRATLVAHLSPYANDIPHFRPTRTRSRDTRFRTLRIHCLALDAPQDPTSLGYPPLVFEAIWTSGCIVHGSIASPHLRASAAGRCLRGGKVPADSIADSTAPGSCGTYSPTCQGKAHLGTSSPGQSCCRGSVHVKDLEKGLGRLQWAPLLQPLWQWKGAVRRMLRLLFQDPYVQSTPFAPWPPWHGASDASASDQKEFYIGGWLSQEPTPSKSSVYWFHFHLDAVSFPWLFKTKAASAMIPALELLGSLILIAFILKMGTHHQVAVKIPTITDNQGNVFSMLNNKTRQMPTAAVLMQLVLTLHRGGAQLAPSHAKRDLNQWADELTHPNLLGFHPDVTTVLSEFSLMNWVLKETYHH